MGSHIRVNIDDYLFHVPYSIVLPWLLLFMPSRGPGGVSATVHTNQSPPPAHLGGKHMVTKRDEIIGCTSSSSSSSESYTPIKRLF